VTWEAQNAAPTRTSMHKLVVKLPGVDDRMLRKRILRVERQLIPAGLRKRAPPSGEPADRRPAETRAGRLPSSDTPGDRDKTPEGARTAARGVHPTGAPAGA